MDRTISSQWFVSSGLLKFYLILNLMFLLIMFFVKWQVSLFLPLFYIPMFMLYYYSKKSHRDVDLQLIASTYVLSNSLAVIIVVIAQGILTIIFGIICFGSKQFFELLEEIHELNPTSFKEMKNIQVEKTFGFYVFLFLLPFVIAAGLEETLKYQMVDRTKRIECQNSPIVIGYQIYAITAALGFSTMENIGYQLAAGLKPDTTVLDSLITATERILIAIPVHCLCGYFTGLRVIRRDIFQQPLSLFDVMKWSILIHGNFDFWLIIIAIHDIGSASIVLSGIIVIFTFVVAYYVVKRERKIVAELKNLLLNKID